MSWVKGRPVLLSMFVAMVILFASTPYSLALPDGNTNLTGVNCSTKHPVSYTYSFQYPNAMEVGKTYTLKIVFKINPSQVTQNPVKVSANIVADGFTVDSTTLDLKASNSIQVTPQKVGATIKVVATLGLDGDTKQHPGYSAVYTDTFTLKSFNISQPSTTSGQTGTGTTPTSNSTQTGTGTTPTSNSTQTGTGTTPTSNSTQTGTGTTPTSNSTQTGTGGTPNPTNSTGTGSTPTGTGSNSTTGGDPPDIISEGNATVYTVKVGDDVLVTITIEVGDLSLVAWYTVRIVGFLAYFTLSLSMLFAIFIKLNRKAFPILNKWHHEISILAVILAFIHAVNNILDASVWSLTIDRVFWVNFTTANAIWISLGVISLYMMIVVTASSFKSVMKRLKFPRWRLIHVSSYILYVFVIVHSLLLGTDMNLLASTSALELFVNFLFVLLAFANTAGVVLILATRKKVVKP